MLTSTKDLLHAAEQHNYAIGAFNVYNLEGVQAVICAAESNQSPVMLQLHPAAFQHGGAPLVALCLSAAQESAIPVAVHLDHSTATDAIKNAIGAGMNSVMADGSHLSYEENVAFTKEMTEFAHAHQVSVEAELGRISGTEDGLTVAEYEARFTDTTQAVDFVERTQIDALAVCIGNVHGKYKQAPQFDFERLAQIHEKVSVPLVLHGASGVPDNMVEQSIALGIRKFNVNTELRQAYIEAVQTHLISGEKVDLLDLMKSAQTAMEAVITAKLVLFKSVGKAGS